ncbi:hypothetical protein IFR04_011513 [Cadophora malorum]|uniref:Uncharacterized protein n=1 Tax=Cadophora malorum TaxID=108018 RepID=A0A8H7W913_9HELO|nr:hypothetical protein IFR04_011513 [Cadophora malorum]
MVIFLSIVSTTLALAQVCHGSYVSKLPHNSRTLLAESMNWMDNFYDAEAGYLRWVLSNSAFHHETRSSAWYAVGLLARNKHKDVANAEKIINNIINAQFKNPEDQWFGDYQQEPEEPEVGSPAYPPSIYGTWDPNWRAFIGTTFVIALEEFGSLLSNATVDHMLASLRNATIGDTYRVGGVDGDNYYASYSNPAIMGAFMSGWTGRRLNDTNMTRTGEEFGKEIIDLFAESSNTLSEFNSATYTGVSLLALSLWGKYLPSESIMAQHGPTMIRYTWEAIGDLWHPQLRNLAGPWDRSYGFDTTRYFSLLSLHLWNIVGKEYSALPESPQTLSHADDFTYAPLFAVLGEYHNSLIPKHVVQKLKRFSGEHTYNTSIISPAYDLGHHRNITAWLAPNISIGGETFDEVEIGGPRQTQTQFKPAVVQWQTGAEIGFISLWPTEKAATIVATPGRLNITYPYGTTSSIFSFIISTFSSRPTIKGWEDIPGLSVNVTGVVNGTFELSFAGLFGGQDEPIYDFEFWNLTYSVPAGCTGLPNVVLDVVTSV